MAWTEAARAASALVRRQRGKRITKQVATIKVKQLRSNQQRISNQAAKNALFVAQRQRHQNVSATQILKVREIQKKLQSEKKLFKRNNQKGRSERRGR